MTINGRTAVAPCGHTGETIIGNYVRCLMGCEGAQVMSKRGVPGHVLNCACAPCQIRRRVTNIVLRDKAGKDFLRIPWDGITNELIVEAPSNGSIRGYLLLDQDGKTVARGTLEVYVEPGKLKVRTNFLIDAVVACVVCKGGLYQSMETLLDSAYARLASFGGAPVTVPTAPKPPGFAATLPATRSSGSPVVVKGPIPVVVKGP
jgi:hypothetical protein